jgi:PST family polysaccharide transporter
LAGLSMIFLALASTQSTVFSTHQGWIVCAWLLGAMTGLTPTYYFQGTSNLRIVALLEVAGGILTFGSVLLLVRGPEDFWRLSLTLVGVRLVIWQILDHQMFTNGKLRYWEGFTFRLGLSALKDGWKIFLVQVAASLYTSFNIVLLGGVSTAYAVAVYGSSERLIRASLAFIAQATSAIFPKLTAMKATDPTRLEAARRTSLLAFAAVSSACLPLIYWMAPVISEFLFHNKLPDVAMVLRIMALVIPAIAISNVLAFHFLVVDRQEHILNWVVFSAVPISLVLGYFLAREHGAIGMATAWVAVEWFVSISLAAIIYYRQKRSQ